MKVCALQMADLPSLEELLKSAGSTPPYSMLSVYRSISCSPNNIVWVAIEGDQVIGCVTVFIETKFVHGGGLVGHIEDVLVHPLHRGQGIAKQLVSSAVKWVRERNCYKVILHCRKELIELYESCGFQQHHEVQMRLDLEEGD